MVTPKLPQLSNLFVASRQYPSNPLALGFDLLTWPFQLAHQVVGTPMVPVPDFLGRFAGPGARPMPALGRVPVAIPRPVPAPAGVIALPAPAAAAPAVVPLFNGGDRVAVYGPGGVQSEQYIGAGTVRQYVIGLDGTRSYVVTMDNGEVATVTQLAGLILRTAS